MDSSTFFNSFYKNARLNSILIMDEKGVILEVNQAFTNAFGYTVDQIRGKYFKLLFVESDQKAHLPEKELLKVNMEGSGDDENFLLHQDGTPTWVTGESVLIETEEGKFIVKIIHNIHAQKQLERYLLESNQILENLFESVKDHALLIINTQMKVMRANKAFLKMFEIREALQAGCKLSEIPHPFWSNENIKATIRKMIVDNIPLNQVYTLIKNNQEHQLRITAKWIVNDGISERQLLIGIKQVNVHAMQTGGL